MLFRRIGARIVDELGVVGTQLTFILVAAIVAGFGEVAPAHTRSTVNAMVIGIIAIGILATIAYEVGSTKIGGSIGKGLFGLHVVDAYAGSRPSTRQSLLRWLLVAAVQPLVWLALGLGGEESLQARIGMIAGITISVLWRAVLLVSLIQANGGGSIHDRIANTRVQRIQRGPPPSAQYRVVAGPSTSP